MSVPLSSSYTLLKTDKQHVVYLEMRACNDAANLAMGPGNDASASTDSVSQPGPKEVSTAPQSASSISSIKKENSMRKVIVSEYVTLDGVMEDPGGAEGFKYGGFGVLFGGGETHRDKIAGIVLRPRLFFCAPIPSSYSAPPRVHHPAARHTV